MSKLYRSLLWSGLVAAGVTACGDNVLPPPPPPPVIPTVHSVSVAPTGITIGVGGQVQMVPSVNADAGVPVTVTWSTGSPSVASVSTGGLVTGVANGPVAITACSTVVTSVCGSASLTVNATAATVTGVTVTPTTAPMTIGQTLTAAAAVQGANNPAQTVTWTSLSPTVASVNATTGVITALSAGTAVITACSTLAGFTGVCGSMSVTIATVSPASVQLSGITWVPPLAAPPGTCVQGPGPSVPVILTSVRCQIEVTSQVNSGDQTLSRLDVVFTQGNVSTVLASQTFTTGPSGAAAFTPISSNITLSMNTTQVRNSSGILVPVVFNGNATISAHLFVVGSSTPIATPAIPVVMNNVDAVVALAVASGPIPAVAATAASPTTPFMPWLVGPVTLTGVQYVAFSQKAPLTLPLTSNICGTSNTNTVSPAGGITTTAGVTVSAVFNCTGKEGGMFLTGFGAPTYAPPLNGPDGTPLTIPTVLSNLGGAFAVNGDQRWNLITPAVPPQTFATIFIDNKPPTITVHKVAFDTLFDQPWINAAHNFVASGDVTAADSGSGLAGSVTANLFTTVCTNTVVVTGADPALTGPTLVSSPAGGRRICGVATDNVGNVGQSVASNFFGIDFLPPVVRMAGTTLATPALAPLLPEAVSNTPNTTIFTTAGAFTNRIWGMEALDDRAGFDQLLLDPLYPSLETLVRSLASGNTTCGLFTNGLGVLLSDNFVRNTTLVPLDCTMGVGYYSWTGVVTDRAGNQASPAVPTLNFAFDPGAPNITGLGYAASLYTGGQPAVFSISANDDLEVVKAALGLNYTGMPNVGCPVGGCQGILYPEGTLTVLDALGNPLMPWTTGPGALPITAVLNAAPITLPYFVGRIDESCIFNGNPYVSCNVGANGTGSRPTVGADYDTNLNGGGVLTDTQKGPNAVLANVADITGRESLTGISAPFLATQFTAVAQPWTAPANPFTWTGAIIAGPIAQVVNTVNTSIINPFFNNGIDLFGGSNAVNLFRMNVVTGQWTFCQTFPVPVPHDNGINRTYTYSLSLPLGTTAAPNQCDALTGPWKAMGLRSGAGLFTPGF